MTPALQALRRLRQRLSGAVASAADQPATSVSEVTPCAPRRSPGRGSRINILLPSINASHYFGGIHTAVMLYAELCRHYPCSRIILLDAAPDQGALERFADHTAISCDVDGEHPRQIVAFNDRYGRTLPVRAGDEWICTGWWTAYAAQRMAGWQGGAYGREGRLAYLIQDFEPGFYPWSSRSAMALSTYRPDRDLAVFNTSLLARYFESTGLTYSNQWTFEPTLNEGLRSALDSTRQDASPRSRRIVVYARPGTPRNAFELLCEGLRAWGWSDPHAREWEVVAVGELAKDIDLGPIVLRAVGKLSIEEYGRLLATSAVGVSLMISPHPSYPPLEMSAFGMGVVTNAYAVKGLEGWCPGTRSLDVLTPEALAGLLADEVRRWEDRSLAPYPSMASDHPFLEPGGMEGIASWIVDCWSEHPAGGAR